MSDYSYDNAAMNEFAAKVTRVEVIDDKGRSYTKWDCQIELSLQDSGRTLKVFVTEKEKRV